jgi:hypothetical protein
MHRFRFLLELLHNGDVLGRHPVTPDSFAPALEWLSLKAMRSGALPLELGARPEVEYAPVWDAARGAPYVEAVRLTTTGPTQGDIPTAYFAKLAKEASSRFVAEGKLEQGELFRYRVVAFGCTEEADHADASDAFEEVSQPLACEESRLDALLDHTEVRGTPQPDEMPVLIPQRVLDEAEALKRDAGGVETGGILLGRLHRDTERRELCLEVTTQIPARHTEAREMRLTFTGDTWTSVRAAIELRGGDELQIGWWHTHPAREWCKNCDPERWKTCPLARSFFSSEDKKLHQMIFPRAYSIALVVGDHYRDGEAWEAFHAVYGWDRGMVSQRGYHVRSETT